MCNRHSVLHNANCEGAFCLPNKVTNYWRNVIWDRDHEEQDNSVEVNTEFRIQRQLTVKAIERMTRKITVLDLGCGTGKIAEQLLSLDNVVQYVGIDINPIAVSTTAARLDTKGISKSRIRIELGDVYELCRKIPDKSVDVVTCIDAFHHLHNPKTILLEISRIMQNDGYFISNVLRRETFSQWEKKRHGVIKSAIINVTYHVCRYVYGVAKLDYIKDKIGELGYVRLVPYCHNEIINLIEDNFTILEFHSSYYYWFMATKSNGQVSYEY